MGIDMPFARGLITVVLLVLFIALWAWTWSRKRNNDYEEAARLPLGDDGTSLPDEERAK